MSAASLSEEICKLHELHSSGELDDREYARAKHSLLRGTCATAAASVEAARGTRSDPARSSQPAPAPARPGRLDKRLWVGLAGAGALAGTAMTVPGVL